MASAAASALKAHKIIFLEEKPRVLVDSHRCVVSHLRLAEAQKILASRSDSGDTVNDRFFFNIANCVHALKNDVNRAHVVSMGSGNLLQELYTRGGSGLVITKNVYEGMRPAEVSDLDTVQDIIRPLIHSGSLLNRSRAQLEADISGMHLLSRGNNVLAVGILKEYSSTQAEICCLAARRDHGRAGSGQTVFRFLERLAMKRGVKDLFVLSTQSMQWFEERGFLPCPPELLPKGREYDVNRGSKVYYKQLRSLLDCTAEEALWNS